MADQKTIDEFLSQSVLAVAGVSRGGKKFGNRVFRNLKSKGYRVFPLNPNTKEVEGEVCYPDLTALPESIDGLVSVVPPEVTETLVRSMAESGIRRIWMQPGAESAAAISLCRQHGIAVVAGECIMLFPTPDRKSP